MTKIRLLLVGALLLLVVALAYNLGSRYFQGNQQYNEADRHYISENDTTDLSVRNETYVSPISIEYLRTLDIQGSGLKLERTLPDGSNYKQAIVSYLSDGNKIYALLTVPRQTIPATGFKAVVFVHGYIPPAQYQTTEKYVAYVDYLARSGLVVLKIDLRGHGQSEGNPGGSYFSNGYTIDALSALKALQSYDSVDPQGIGIWGHSMAGNLVLRSMLVSNEFKAGVIWGGAVYSYEDFAKYRINDASYAGRSRPDRPQDPTDTSRENSEQIQKLRSEPESLNFEDDFWKSISLTENLRYLNAPLQLHHSVNDNVVNIGYMRDLVKALQEKNKTHFAYEYATGGHNIESPAFESAMSRTVEFFKQTL